MRRRLDTNPSIDKRLSLVTRIDRLLQRPQACLIANETRDTVVRQTVPRPEAINVSGKRPVVDTALLAYAVAAKAGLWVEDVRGGEIPGLTGLVPVAAPVNIFLEKQKGAR